MGDGKVRKVAIILNGDVQLDSKHAHANNVSQMAKFLKQEKFDHIAVANPEKIKEADAYQSGTRKGIEALLQGIKTDDDDFIVVYKTGHAGTEDGFSCTALQDGNCYSDAELKAQLDKIAYGRRIVIADGCKTGKSSNLFANARTSVLAYGSGEEFVNCQELNSHLLSERVVDKDGNQTITLEDRLRHAIKVAKPTSTPQFTNFGLPIDLSGKEGAGPFKDPKTGKDLLYEADPNTLDAQLDKLAPGQLALVCFSEWWCGPCHDYEPKFKAMRLDGRFMKIHALNKKGSKTNWDKWNLEGYPTVAFIDRNRNIYFVDNRDIQDPVNGRKTFRPADLEAQAAQIKAQLSGLKTVEQADKLLRTVPRNPKLAMLLMDALLKASVTHPKPEVRIFLEEICKTAADLARRTSGESQKGEKKYMTELSQRLQSEDRKIRLAATLVYMSFPEFAKGIPNEEDLKLIYRNASDSEDAQLAFVSKVAMRAFYKYAEENSFLFRPNKIPPLTEEQKKTFMADVLAAPWTYVRQHGLDVLKQSPEIVPHHVDVLFSYLNDPRTNQLQEAIDLLVGLSKTDAALQKRLLALLRHSKFKDDRLQIMLAEKLVDAGAKVDWQPFLKHKNEMIRLEALIYLSLRGEATPEIKAGWMDFTDQTKKFNPLPYVALAIVASGDKLQDFALQRFKDLASQSPQDYEKNFAGFIETLEFLQNPQVKGEVPEHLLKTSPVLVPALVAVLIKNVENMDAVFSQDASAALNLWTMLAGEEISKKLKELSESDQLSAVQRHIAFGIAAPLLLLEESNTAKVAAKLVYLKQNFDQYLQWLEHPNGFYQMAAFMAIFTVIQQNAEAEIKKVLRIIQNPNSNLRLRLLLKNSFRFRPQDDPYQIAAKQGLKEIAPTQLTAALKSDNEELIDFALVHLGSFPDKAILYKEELFALVEHPKEEIRERAILVLINIEDEAIRLRLEKRLKNNLAKLKNTLPTEENEKLKTKEYELLYGLKLKQKHESLYWDLAPTAMALANSNQEALVLGVGVSLSLAYNGGKMMVGTNFNSGYMARKGGEIYAWEKPGSFKFGGWLNIQTMARFNFHKYSRKISGFVDLPAIGLGHLYGDYYNSPFFTLSPGGIGVDFRIGKNSSRFHIQGRPQFYLNKETWLAGGTLSLGFSFF